MNTNQNDNPYLSRRTSEIIMSRHSEIIMSWQTAKKITLLEDGVRLSTSDRLRWRTGRATSSFGEQDTLVIVWWSRMMGPESKLQIPEERCAVSSWNIKIHSEQDNLISYKYPCIRTKVTKYTHSHITQIQAKSHLTILARLFHVIWLLWSQGVHPLKQVPWR